MKRFSLVAIVTMSLKRATTRETITSNIGEAIEQAPVNLPIYADTYLFIEKESTLTWKQVQ